MRWFIKLLGFFCKCSSYLSLNLLWFTYRGSLRTKGCVWLCNFTSKFLLKAIHTSFANFLLESSGNMGASEDQSSSCERRQSSKNVVINVEEEGESQDPSRGHAHPQRSPRRKDFSRSQHHVSPRDKRRKLNGVRHLRRLENLNLLLSQAEADEDDSGEVDFVDLVSHQNSAFHELFMEPDKMSAWVAFVNSSEDEQDQILASAE